MPRIVITINLQSPWFSQLLKRLRSKKKRIFSSAEVTGTQERWSDYQTVATEYKQALKDAKDSIFNATLPSLLITNHKQFWNVVSKRDYSSTTLKDTNNRIIKLDESADILNSVFVSAFSQSVCFVTPTYASSDFLTMDPIVFDAAGIEKIIKDLKVSLSCGVDGINSKFLISTKVYSAIIPANYFSNRFIPVAIRKTGR